MKKLLYVIFAIGVGVVFLQSCDKDSLGDSYDNFTSLPPYVEISSKDTLQAVEGTTVTIGMNLRTAVQQPTTVEYAVSGAFSATGTVTIPRNKTTASAQITIPAGVIPSGEDTAEAVFSIKSAKTGSTNLTIGLHGADEEMVAIEIEKD